MKKPKAKKPLTDDQLIYERLAAKERLLLEQERAAESMRQTIINFHANENKLGYKTDAQKREEQEAERARLLAPCSECKRPFAQVVGSAPRVGSLADDGGDFFSNSWPAGLKKKK